MKRLLSALLIVFMSIGIFVSCSSDKKAPSDEAAPEVETVSDASSSDAQPKEQSSLGKIEVEESKDGTKVAKSETGVEVECTMEAFEELSAEYDKVKGTDEAKEKELMAKMQLWIESQLTE